MPYIKQEERARCNSVVNQMTESGVKANGDLNYILFKYCKEHVEPSTTTIKIISESCRKPWRRSGEGCWPRTRI